MIILIFICWWASGFSIFLHTVWTIDKKITVRDCIISCIAGMFGVFTLILYFGYAEKKWLDKRVF